jgi:monothiol glutaredoxin
LRPAGGRAGKAARGGHGHAPKAGLDQRFAAYFRPDFLPLHSPYSKQDRPMSDVQKRIDDLVKGNRVMLFMKGTAQFPQCGFSGRAIQVLKASGATEVKTFNVLEDEDVRQGIKDYAQWPTIPQLYIDGEFVGGSDIMMEMYQSGELKQLLQKA